MYFVMGSFSVIGVGRLFYFLKLNGLVIIVDMVCLLFLSVVYLVC